MTDGSLSNGARAVTDANLAENSPNDRCCDRSAISPNAAASQNAVVPPLPRATMLPFGRPKGRGRPAPAPPHPPPPRRLPVRRAELGRRRQGGGLLRADL